MSSAADDGGGGTLRSVIGNAQTLSGDTIVFSPMLANATITLDATNKGSITTAKKLTIDGSNQTTHGTQNISISGNDGTNQVRIFNFTGAASTEEVDYLTLTGGQAVLQGPNDPGYGGAILGIGTLKLNNDTFTSNAAVRGGAVSWSGAATDSLTVNNSNFRSNVGDDPFIGIGGAIYTRVNTTLNTDAFTSNSAVVAGGAVVATGPAGTTLTATANVYTNNHITGQDNQANLDGGGLWTADTTIVTGGSFTGNTAYVSGGAIAYEPVANNNSSLTVSNITFTNNSAAVGGGLYSFVQNTSGSVSVNVSGCLFATNHAIDDGHNNPRPAAGGGLAVSHSTSVTASASLAVTNSTFYLNDSTKTGGGLYIFTDGTGTGTNTSILTSLTVTKNIATTNGGFGGGIYYLRGQGAAPQVRNCIIAGNSLTSQVKADGYDVYVSPSQQGQLPNVNSLGFNLIGLTDGSGGWTITDQKGSGANPLDPGLDPNGPTDNGGPTFTIKLVPNSKAYRMGDPNLGGTTDQRGYKRDPNTVNVSVGAFDPDATPPPPPGG